MLGFGLNQAHEFFIMQSDEYKQKVMKEMYEIRYNCNDIEDLIITALSNCKVDKEDFTQNDWNELIRYAEQLK